MQSRLPASPTPETFIRAPDEGLHPPSGASPPRLRRIRAPGRRRTPPSGAQGEGWTLESGPREYACSPGCYAVFPYDPDGIKLEIVHTPA